ncbi:hypothetical protein ACV2HG_06775 [Salmonella enterica subsp. enterica serovar Pomona]|nr:hypothetical protein [Salmonella enterica]EBQ9782441.1 hypothetical protein [Salmonella enterica subsp. enterica serovar Inganda]ECH8970753.1 hypothetical protein [Salmonella enterica subsp. enterica]EEA0256552.1 hypothetical protein [Salmonella enterica subsp. enterica serovar Infantis]EKR1709241.1 hypothetical protein [Salmonella enterica subsp. enterica serovar Carrau]
MALNLFDSLNAARRLTELSGAVLERSKRYPQRYALRTTPPKCQMPGEVEITVCNKGQRRCVHAARVSGCTVYWED